MKWFGAAVLAVVLASGCQGERGPQGPQGPEGTVGEPGAEGDAGTSGGTGGQGNVGTAGCDSPAAGEGPGLNVEGQLSAPANGQFFTPGERPVFTVTLTDRCNRVWRPTDLGTANLYLAGPRGALTTVTPNGLLNAVEDRAAADRQHHYINLKAPKFKDSAQNNLSIADDGTITYTFGAVSGEAPGTYSVGLWVKTPDELNQEFPTFEFQVGTATVEPLSSGPPESSTCLACHQGTQNGIVYLAHMRPGRTPIGNLALDSAPIATCKMCHNNDGYSRNPIIRKVHGVHRGHNMKAPGVAHPDYGLGADNTLLDYTNVGFASIPGAEKDCQACHVDDRWKTMPSRLACGTCHDNVFFDTGTLSPPRIQGKLANNAACTASSECNALYGTLSACNTATGTCERQTHPAQTSDAQCATCHTAEAPASGPDLSIAGNHDIPSRTKARGLALTDVTLTGGSLPNGTFTVGDRPKVTFRLKDKTGASVTNVLTNTSLSGSVIIGGPNNDPRRVLGAVTMAKNTDLTYDATGDLYTYTLPTGLPSQNAAPFNNPDPSWIRDNPSGSYTFYFYIVETGLPGGARDSVGSVQSFRFVRAPTESTTSPVRGRDVIAEEACNSCHVDLQLHGGSRSDPEGCFTCHNAGAMDKTAGAQGRNCTAPEQCGGFAGGWETCTGGKCTITVDPTPNQTVNLGPMVHQIHFGRLLGGYATRDNLIEGGLPIIAYQNSVNDFGEVLFPMDIRNCSKCHADSGATCTNTNGCGFGQQCSAGKCVNVAWTVPGSTACLSCHDTAAAYAHAALNTININNVATQTCDVCHGPGREFSAQEAHDITNPYVPPYPREKE